MITTSERPDTRDPSEHLTPAVFRIRKVFRCDKYGHGPGNLAHRMDDRENPRFVADSSNPRAVTFFAINPRK